MPYYRPVIASTRRLWGRVWVLVIAFASLPAASVTPFEQAVRDSLSASFATASLLGDDDVIKFGVWDFNPNKIIETNDENLGSDESTELRQDLRQFSFPLRWRLSSPDQEGELSLMAKFAYLDVEREQQLVPSPDLAEDRIYHQVSSAGIGLGYIKALDDHWDISLKGYTTWMHYHNELDFNTAESRQLEALFDDVLSNVDIDLLMAEPILGIHYNWERSTIRYRLFSDYHYLRGRAIDPETNAHKLQPEAWYWSNGIALQKPLANNWDGHSVWLRLSRTDMGGDLSGELGALNYYEVGVAWLVETPESWAFIRNLGVGFNLNYGSDLRGGTLIFLYNFDEFR